MSVNEKTARGQAEANGLAGATAESSAMTSNDLIRMINKKRSQVEVNVVVKADVQGSLTSVIDSLKSLENEEVALSIVGSGVGNITESDVHMASTSDAIIYGFNVTLPSSIKRIASRDKVSIQIFHVIYELLDSFKAEASSRLAPELIESVVGELEIEGVFRTSKSEIICGGKVLSGKAVPGVHARIARGGQPIGEVEVTSVKRGPNEAKEVFEGDMCGLQLKIANKLVIEKGDRVTFFTSELVARSL